MLVFLCSLFELNVFFVAAATVNVPVLAGIFGALISLRNA